MKELTSHKVNGCNDQIQVFAVDGPGPGGASHHYRIELPAVETADTKQPPSSVNIFFQKGPILECGVNGLTHENLLAILIDRMEGFQSGPYACDENAAALTALQTAQGILKARTEKRLARGVEGTHKV